MRGRCRGAGVTPFCLAIFAQSEVEEWSSDLLWSSMEVLGRADGRRGDLQDADALAASAGRPEQRLGDNLPLSPVIGSSRLASVAHVQGRPLGTPMTNDIVHILCRIVLRVGHTLRLGERGREVPCIATRSRIRIP